MSRLLPSEITQRLRNEFTDSQLPKAGLDVLFNYYTLLVLTKGESVTNSDVHNAWVLWALQFDPQNTSIRPYYELDEQTQSLDTVFTDAIRKVAKLIH